MNLFEGTAKKLRSTQRGRSALMSSITYLACICAVAAGCSKDAADTTARPATQAAGAQSGSPTVTPAQEAAKKRGMEQGPAVAAAMAAARGKKQ